MGGADGARGPRQAGAPDRRVREPVARRGEGGGAPSDDVDHVRAHRVDQPAGDPHSAPHHRARAATGRASLLAQEGDASLARVAPRARPRGKGASPLATPPLRAETSGRGVVPRVRRAPRAGHDGTGDRDARRLRSGRERIAGRSCVAGADRSTPSGSVRTAWRSCPGGGSSWARDDDLPCRAPRAPRHAVAVLHRRLRGQRRSEYRACSERGRLQARRRDQRLGRRLRQGAQGVRPPLQHPRPERRGSHPINCVDWEMAQTVLPRRRARACRPRRSGSSPRAGPTDASTRGATRPRRPRP